MFKSEENLVQNNRSIDFYPRSPSDVSNGFESLNIRSSEKSVEKDQKSQYNQSDSKHSSRRIFKQRIRSNLRSDEPIIALKSIKSMKSNPHIKKLSLFSKRSSLIANTYKQSKKLQNNVKNLDSSLGNSEVLNLVSNRSRNINTKRSFTMYSPVHGRNVSERPEDF